MAAPPDPTAPASASASALAPVPVPVPAAALPRSTRAQRALLAIALVFLLKEGQPLLAPVVIAVLLTFVLAPLVR